MKKEEEGNVSLPTPRYPLSGRDASVSINTRNAGYVALKLGEAKYCVPLCELFSITRPAKFERTARVARAIGVVAVGQDCT